MLFKDKLSPADKTKAKAAAQNLLVKLQDADIKKIVLTVGWYKDTMLQGRVKKLVGDILNKDLPDSYDRDVFSE